MNPSAWSNLRAVLQRARTDTLKYFNVAGDLEPQADVEAAILAGVPFRGSQLLVLIFAIFIASLGLNTNSIPVIIGAMLISPLMGPIIGMGLALGTENYALLRRGLRNISMAILGSLAASALYFLLSPQYEGASQLLARTSPSIYDVFIALFGGAAGIVSIACRNKGQVMPGVAIATSLMPPLCTAGYGLATMQGHFFFGALYLFFTNMIFILVASWVGVKLMGFSRMVYTDTRRYRKVKIIIYAIVAAMLALSAWLTVNMARNNLFKARASQFVETQMVFPNTQVLAHKEYTSDGRRHIDVTLIGERLPHDSLQLAMMNKLDSVGLGGTLLSIKQGFALDPATDRELDERDFGSVYSVMQQQVAARQSEVDSLRALLDNLHRRESQAAAVAPEVRVIFPGVEDIAMSRMLVASTADGMRTDTADVLFVRAPRGLAVSERERLAKYMEVRLGRSDLHVIVNPSGFPWSEQ